MADSLIYQYRRVNLRTGNEYIGTFDEAQLPDLHFLPHRTIEQQAKAKVAHWNRNQPTEWRYVYLGAKVATS